MEVVVIFGVENAVKSELVVVADGELKFEVIRFCVGDAVDVNSVVANGVVSTCSTFTVVVMRVVVFAVNRSLLTFRS